jgi:hypothetical protein
MSTSTPIDPRYPTLLLGARQAQTNSGDNRRLTRLEQGGLTAPTSPGSGAVTSVTDTSTIDLTVTGHDLSGVVKPNSIDSSHIKSTATGTNDNMLLTSAGRLRLTNTSVSAGLELGGTELMVRSSLSSLNAWTQVQTPTWDGGDGGEFYRFRIAPSGSLTATISPSVFANGTSGRRGTLDISDPVGDGSYKYAGSEVLADTAIGSATIVVSSALTGMPVTGAIIVGDEVKAYTSWTGTTITLESVTAAFHRAGTPVRDARNEWTRLSGANGLGTTYWINYESGSLYWTGRGSFHGYVANHRSTDVRPKINIASVSDSGLGAGNGTLITTTTNHNLITGDSVDIEGAVGGGTYSIDGPNGYFLITRRSATTFTLDGSTFPGAGGTFGNIQPHAYKESAGFQTNLTGDSYGGLLEGCEFALTTLVPTQTQGATIVCSERPAYFEYKATGGGSGAGLPARLNNSGSIGLRLVAGRESGSGQLGTGISLESSGPGYMRRAFIYRQNGVEIVCLDGVTGYLGLNVVTDQTSPIPARLTVGTGSPVIAVEGIQLGTVLPVKLWRSADSTLQTDSAFGVGPATWTPSTDAPATLGSVFVGPSGIISLSHAGGSSTGRVFKTFNTASATNPEFAIFSEGTLKWAASNTTPDVTLARSGASTLTLTGNLTVTGTVTGGASGYAVLAGQAGTANDLTVSTDADGSIYGSAASGHSLKLNSTSHATKGSIFFGTASAYDGVNSRLGIANTAPPASLSLGTGAVATAAEGVQFGTTTPVFMYRSGARILTVDRIMAIGNLAVADPQSATGTLNSVYIDGTGVNSMVSVVKTSGNAFRSYTAVGASENPRFQISITGGLGWGPGGATAVDNTLIRNGTAGMLMSVPSGTGFSITGGYLGFSSTDGTAYIFTGAQSANPTVGAASQVKVYLKAGKWVFQYNDAGTTRYTTIDLITGAVVNGTTAP